VELKNVVSDSGCIVCNCAEVLGDLSSQSGEKTRKEVMIESLENNGGGADCVIISVSRDN
jgi:hypothetical protein